MWVRVKVPDINMSKEEELSLIKAGQLKMFPTRKCFIMMDGKQLMVSESIIRDFLCVYRYLKKPRKRGWYVSFNNIKDNTGLNFYQVQYIVTIMRFLYEPLIDIRYHFQTIAGKEVATTNIRLISDLKLKPRFEGENRKRLVRYTPARTLRKKGGFELREPRKLEI